MLLGSERILTNGMMTVVETRCGPDLGVPTLCPPTIGFSVTADLGPSQGSSGIMTSSSIFRQEDTLESIWPNPLLKERRKLESERWTFCMWVSPSSASRVWLQLSKVVRCSTLSPIPIWLTQSYSIAGNSFSQVHYFHCLFLLYACILAAACLALLKDVCVFWSLPSPLLSKNGKSIWVSFRGYSLKKIAGDGIFVTQLTLFCWAIETSSTRDEAQCYWTVYIQGGLLLTCQVFIPLSHCHWLIWSLHWLISFKFLHIDLIKLAYLIHVEKFWGRFI